MKVLAKARGQDREIKDKDRREKGVFSDDMIIDLSGFSTCSDKPPEPTGEFTVKAPDTLTRRSTSTYQAKNWTAKPTAKTCPFQEHRDSMRPPRWALLTSVHQRSQSRSQVSSPGPQRGLRTAPVQTEEAVTGAAARAPRRRPRTAGTAEARAPGRPGTASGPRCAPLSAQRKDLPPLPGCFPHQMPENTAGPILHRSSGRKV